jgi:release factor glutamine methyltransferase
LDIAQRNAQKHEVDIDFSLKNILTYSEPIHGVIVSNPPYIGQNDYLSLEPELAFEPRIALTDEYNGLLFYTAIAKLIESNRLNVEAFFLEIGYGQAQDVENLFTHLADRVHRIKDLSSIDRVIWGLVN